MHTPSAKQRPRTMKAFMVVAVVAAVAPYSNFLSLAHGPKHKQVSHILSVLGGQLICIVGISEFRRPLLPLCYVALEFDILRWIFDYTDSTFMQKCYSNTACSMLNGPLILRREVSRKNIKQRSL
jgi:hypothetical protein